MYAQSARAYDLIYQAMKDYAAEAQHVHDLVSKYGRSEGNRLLDVACGTGLHLEHFRRRYEVEGLELSPEMLAFARNRLPEVPLHEGDMESFELPTRFDVVTCMFSAIGYMLSQERLERAVACFARHLVPGGVVLFEPWLMPEAFRPGYLSLDAVDQPEIKVARMARSWRERDIHHFVFYYSILTAEGYEHFEEPHAVRLATHEQYLDAIKQAGLVPHHDPEGPFGRGMYIGVKP